MKKTIHICDICHSNTPDAKIKYKYRAKKVYRVYYEHVWLKIELCQDCLDKIIEAERKEEENE